MKNSSTIREISAFWLPEDFRQVERSRNRSRPGTGSPDSEAGRVAGDQEAEEATAAGQEYGAAWQGRISASCMEL